MLGAILFKNKILPINLRSCVFGGRTNHIEYNDSYLSVAKKMFLQIQK